MDEKKKDTQAAWKTTDILKTGEILDDRYKVIRKISQGGFGQVYEVELVTDDPLSLTDSQYDTKHYYMKQARIKRGSHLALKVESHQLSVTVLKQEYDFLSKLRVSNYFMKCLDFGEKDTFKYMVQTLGGTDLATLQRSRPGTCFTLETSFRLCYDMLAALNYLHDVGIIHKDVKPSNYLLSQSKDNTVVLVDFGIAKRVTTANGSLIKNDSKNAQKFVGTHIYASLKTQEKKPSWKSDDLISLYYSLLSMTKHDILPWRKLKEKTDIMQTKREFNMQNLHILFPEEANILLTKLYAYIIPLEYGDEINYAYIYELFENLFDEWGVSESDPYEWEDAGATEAAQQADAASRLIAELEKSEKKSRKNKYHEGNIQNDSNSYDEDDVNRIGKKYQYGSVSREDTMNNNWINKQILNRFFCMRL